MTAAPITRVGRGVPTPSRPSRVRRVVFGLPFLYAVGAVAYCIAATVVALTI